MISASDKKISLCSKQRDFLLTNFNNYVIMLYVNYYIREGKFLRIMFTREDTKAVKGLAVLMMLFHHLAAFPERMPPEFEGFQSLWPDFTEKRYLIILGTSCRLCVAIFYFVGGYGMYKRWSKNKYHLVTSIAALYKSYWKVFAVFVPIAFIFFQRKGEGFLPNYQRYAVTDTKELISMILANFLGLTDSINSEWWFLAAYLCVMPMGLLFCIVTKKNKSFTVDMFWVLIIDILVRNVFSDIPNIEAFSNLGGNFFYSHFLNMAGTSPFFAGIVFAKHDKLELCKKYLMRYRISSLIGLSGCLGVLYVRSFILGEYIEIIHAPRRLNDQERIRMMEHPRLGYELLEKNFRFPESVNRTVLEHHEWYNGLGYPNHRRGNDLLFTSRVLKAADVYDAMTSKRPYHPPYLPSEVMEYIMGRSGMEFDPAIVEVMSRSMCVYPVGCEVELSNSERAIVISNHEGYVLRPTVKLIRTGDVIDLQSDHDALNLTIVKLMM